MVDSLDAIPWSTLNDGHGNAGNTPKFIHALDSDDPDKRNWAQQRLEIGEAGAVYYDSVPFVVRILLQMLHQKDLREKPWIIEYLSQAFHFALDIETYEPDPTPSITEQIMSDIRSQASLLFNIVDLPDFHMSLYILRLLMLLQADLPHLKRLLEEKLQVETDESIRAALVFCLSLFMDSIGMPSIQAILENASEPALIRVAAGIGLISRSEEAISDSVITDLCAVIEKNSGVLEKFDRIYTEYLTPFGAPPGKNRSMDCLRGGSSAQRDQIVNALLSVYTKLVGRRIRIGSAYYLEAMVRLAFLPGKLPAETTIRDLTTMQRAILTAFQHYDLDTVRWDVYMLSDYRQVLGLDFRNETDFLDFMSGKRSARQPK